MFDQLLDILYPPTCVSCAKDGAWLCSRCLSNIRLFDGEQEKLTPFRSVTICGKYANPFFRRVLTAFKYRSARCLREVFGKILIEFRTQYLSPWPWAKESEITIVSIPTDKKHIRERGLDHAAIYADLVKEILIPWGTRKDILTRIRRVSAQAVLPADKLRQVNMNKVFLAAETVETPILLVDDILTTGSTALEAARALQEKGMNRIHLFVFATGK